MTIEQLKICHACTNPCKEFCNSTPELCGFDQSAIIYQSAIDYICNADFTTIHEYTREHVMVTDVQAMSERCDG